MSRNNVIYNCPVWSTIKNRDTFFNVNDLNESLSKFDPTFLGVILIVFSKILHSRCQRSVWNRSRPLVPIKKNFRIRENLKADVIERKTGRIVKDPPPVFHSYDEEFAKVTSFENQLQSLSQRGFQRAWKPYKPPSNMEVIFASACQKILGNEWQAVSKDFSKKTLAGTEKVRLLSYLTEVFSGHRVPNSMLHTMTTMDKVFSFYSTEVNHMSPYDHLEAGVKRGTLPQNLYVQLEPVRFDPVNATHDLGRVTAFPGDSTIMVTPESRKKWKDRKAKKSPYRNSEDDEDVKTYGFEED